MNTYIDDFRDLNKNEIKEMIVELQKEVALLEFETKKISQARISKQGRILKLKRLLEEKC